MAENPFPLPSTCITAILLIFSQNRYQKSLFEIQLITNACWIKVNDSGERRKIKELTDSAPRNEKQRLSNGETHPWLILRQSQVINIFWVYFSPRVAVDSLTFLRITKPRCDVGSSFLYTMFECGYKSQYIGGKKEKFLRCEYDDSLLLLGSRNFSLSCSCW